LNKEPDKTHAFTHPDTCSIYVKHVFASFCCYFCLVSLLFLSCKQQRPVFIT